MTRAEMMIELKRLLKIAEYNKDNDEIAPHYKFDCWVASRTLFTVITQVEEGDLEATDEQLYGLIEGSSWLNDFDY